MAEWGCQVLTPCAPRGPAFPPASGRSLTGAPIWQKAAAGCPDSRRYRACIPDGSLSRLPAAPGGRVPAFRGIHDNTTVKPLTRATGKAHALAMPNWHVRVEGRFIRLLHNQADEEGPVWSGTVEVWRGAPGADSHPELFHAFLSIANAAVHQEFVRHQWSYEIPDTWGGHPNYGQHRRFMILQARGGMLNWTLVLAFPLGAPQLAWRAVAKAFNATQKETAMTVKGPDQTAKSASLEKGAVPEAKAPPAEAKEGMNSVVNQG